MSSPHEKAKGEKAPLKKRESFKKSKKNGSFEGSFFMDFYFSQGDYKVGLHQMA